MSLSSLVNTRLVLLGQLDSKSEGFLPCLLEYFADYLLLTCLRNTDII